jgi:hypothetical protein
MRRLPPIPGECLAYPAVPEFPISTPSPLLPQVATEPPPYPGIHLFQRRLYFRKAKISVPAFEIAPQVPYDSRECHPSRPACLLAYLVFERLEGLLAHPTPVGVRSREAEPPERPSPGAVDRTLGLVHHQLQLASQEPRHAGEHPLPGPGALHGDLAIIRLAHKAVASSLELLIQAVQEQIGQQW